MSKSLGNVVNPMDILGLYGPDALRYYLLREVIFGLDGTFTTESFETRFNGDLANDLGNLVSRSLTMLEKYFEGVVPKPGPSGELESQMASVAGAYAPAARQAMGKLEFHTTLMRAWDLVKRANKYIDETAPYKIAKEGEAGREKLATVMFTLVEALRVTALAIAPFMPFTAQAIWAQLGYSDEIQGHSLAETGEWGKIPVGQKIAKGAGLFPRIEKKK
ncbi:MAG TPA: class I tRNA ligase family protein, partial [bacterium]|nr:class I tRNA ligase family protein [bacterium]